METFEKTVNLAFKNQDIQAIDRYLKARLDELDSLAQRGDPWVFGACCTFIEMLAKREKECNNNSMDGPRFKNFVKIYLMPSNPLYQDAEKELKTEATKNQNATKQSGKEQAKRDDPEIAKNLWHILRCGVVHSFSMKTNDGEFKIFLGHRKNSESCSSRHLQVINVKDKVKNEDKTYKALLIMAEDFVEDLRKCTQSIIKKAKKDPSFCRNLEEKFQDNPPFGWLKWAPTKNHAVL